jgi:CCR4-NOT transcriptional complex subunit CAF120
MASVLTSPFSNNDHGDGSSVLTSPFSMSTGHTPDSYPNSTVHAGAHPTPLKPATSPPPSQIRQSPVITQQPTPPATVAPHTSEDNDLRHEAGARYMMSLDQPANTRIPRWQAQNQAPNPNAWASDSDDTHSPTSPGVANTSALRPHKRAQSPEQRPQQQQQAAITTSPSKRTSMLYAAGEAGASSRTSLTHRPSGARAPPASRSRFGRGQSSDLRSQGNASPASGTGASVNVDPSRSSPKTTTTPPPAPAMSTTHGGDDDAAYATEAMAAMNFLDRDQQQAPVPAATSEDHSIASASTTSLSSSGTAPAPGQDAAYKSSFAPSKTAAERRAKAQAQQMAHSAAVNQPGRSKSKRANRKMPVQTGTWSSEEEEEEDDDDEEDDDVDSDEDVRRREPTVTAASMNPAQSVHNDMYGQGRQLPQAPSPGYSEFNVSVIMICTDIAQVKTHSRKLVPLINTPLFPHVVSKKTTVLILNLNTFKPNPSHRTRTPLLVKPSGVRSSMLATTPRTHPALITRIPSSRWSHLSRA